MSVVISSVQKIVVMCEGPRCTGNDGKGPLALSWEEAVQQQPPVEQKASASLPVVPDDAYRLVLAQYGFDPVKHVFCSRRCRNDWENEFYVPAKSPRELSEELKINLEATKKRAQEVAARNPEKLGDDALGENPPAERVSVPQADGDSSA